MNEDFMNTFHNTQMYHLSPYSTHLPLGTWKSNRTKPNTRLKHQTATKSPTEIRKKRYKVFAANSKNVSSFGPTQCHTKTGTIFQRFANLCSIAHFACCHKPAHIAMQQPGRFHLSYVLHLRPFWTYYIICLSQPYLHTRLNGCSGE